MAVIPRLPTPSLPSTSMWKYSLEDITLPSNAPASMIICPRPLANVETRNNPSRFPEMRCLRRYDQVRCYLQRPQGLGVRFLLSIHITAIPYLRSLSRAPLPTRPSPPLLHPSLRISLPRRYNWDSTRRPGTCTHQALRARANNK